MIDVYGNMIITLDCNSRLWKTEIKLPRNCSQLLVCLVYFYNFDFELNLKKEKNYKYFLGSIESPFFKEYALHMSRILSGDCQKINFSTLTKVPFLIF